MGNLLGELESFYLVLRRRALVEVEFFFRIFGNCNRQSTHWATFLAGDGAEGRGADL